MEPCRDLRQASPLEIRRVCRGPMPSCRTAWRQSVRPSLALVGAPLITLTCGSGLGAMVHGGSGYTSIPAPPTRTCCCNSSGQIGRKLLAFHLPVIQASDPMAERRHRSRFGARSRPQRHRPRIAQRRQRENPAFRAELARSASGIASHNPCEQEFCIVITTPVKGVVIQAVGRSTAVYAARSLH